MFALGTFRDVFQFAQVNVALATLAISMVFSASETQQTLAWVAEFAMTKRALMMVRRQRVGTPRTQIHFGVVNAKNTSSSGLPRNKPLLFAISARAHHTWQAIHVEINSL